MILKNPLEQFEIFMLRLKYIYINTNTTGFFIVGLFVYLWIYIDNDLNSKTLINNFCEEWFETDAVRYISGCKHGAWPFVITIPYIILTYNWIAYWPQMFVAFSTIVIPSFIATMLLMFALIIQLAYRRLRYLGIYCPIAGEHWLRPFIIIIESFAYFAKYLSISLRLFANIVSGHVILEVLGKGVTMSFFSNSYICFIVALVLNTALFLMELFIAFFQAFLFIALMCMYSGD